MSNSAWCDLNRDVTILKLQDMCPSSKRKCEKPISITPDQYELEDKTAGWQLHVWR